MAMNESTLKITGYKDQPVPNTFITQSIATKHLGIILPGYRHTADKADLHFAGRILLERGADLLRVEYAYNQTDFMKRPDNEQNEWLSNDVFAACNAGLAQRTYERITMVGKSLGTLAMGHLLADKRFQSAACVWSTPLLTVEWLCKRIEQVKPRSLFIIGTADGFYKPDVLAHLEKVTGGRSVVLNDVNHGLEVPDSVSRSLTALNQIVAALQEFIT